MCNSGEAQEPLLDFLRNCFLDSENRTCIVEQWLTLNPSTFYEKGIPSISVYFADFIKAVLYGERRIVVRRNYMTVFGERLPLYRHWLRPNGGKDAWASLEEASPNLFETCKVCADGNYLYSDALDTRRVDEILSTTLRRELLRDFCWIVAAKRKSGYTLALIVGLQTILNDLHAKRKQDAFISNLHAACQGKCKLEEVLITHGDKKATGFDSRK